MYVDVREYLRIGGHDFANYSDSGLDASHTFLNQCPTVSVCRLRAAVCHIFVHSFPLYASFAVALLIS